MTIVVKERDPLVVPLNIRRRAGIKPGDRLEFKASRGVITIVSRSQITREETMKWQHSARSKEDYASAPVQIQKAFDMQVRLLAENLF